MNKVEPQWIPSQDDMDTARITDFARYVHQQTGVKTQDYHQLWQWSITHLEDFWRVLSDYFDVGHSSSVLTSSSMPGARWFEGTELNYVDQVIRNVRDDAPAIVHIDEGGDSAIEVSWTELTRQAGAFAATLRNLGVQRGDRVVGYLPNIPEAVVAFLATASLGAVWSVCGQDYTASAALARLKQLDPTVLVAADGYTYGGKTHDKRTHVAELQAGLPSLRATVLVSRTTSPSDPRDSAHNRPHEAGMLLDWDDSVAGDEELQPVAVAFDHPLWIVFSSGTTGLPKGIVHGHGGVLLEHLKVIALQCDIGDSDTMFWYTSPSWMMWNVNVAGLLVGATIVCYAGSPAAPATDSLWQIAARAHVTVLGTSPGYLLECAKAGAVPKTDHNLAVLRTVSVTGAPLPPSSAMWLRDNVGAAVRINSISGGTDVVSAFIGGVRTVPAWPGELSVPYLGVALEAFNAAGEPVRGEVGELVIAQPMPSMPICFWNDPDGQRYREAYFETYPGLWRHGDWITITERDSVIVHGRSDSTLNRNGVRMGSADIYQVVENMPEVKEALVIGAQHSDGSYWMPLFLVLANGVRLDRALQDRINAAIRSRCSPRHVPDEIIDAPGVPHTRTGKKLEVPIKRLFEGENSADVVDPNAVDDPELVDWYARQAQGRLSKPEIAAARSRV